MCAGNSIPEARYSPAEKYVVAEHEDEAMCTIWGYYPGAYFVWHHLRNCSLSKVELHGSDLAVWLPTRFCSVLCHIQAAVAVAMASFL